MISNQHNNNKPSYEELETLCRKLQDKVAASIAVQQELIQKKNELNKELNRFKLIDSYTKEAFFYENVSDFAMLTVEYFIQAFEQPHCLFAEYDADKKKLDIQAVFGFKNTKVPRQASFNETLLKSRASFFLNGDVKLNEALSFLYLTNGILCPFFDYHGIFIGLIICGQREDDRFYSPIDKNIRHTFTMMSHKTGTLLTNLKKLTDN